MDKLLKLKEKFLLPTVTAWQDWVRPACSRVASLLWATAAGVEKRDSLTIIQKNAYWIMPPAIKRVPYVPLAKISFVGKKRKNAIITKDTL